MKEYIERETLLNLIQENSETKFDWSECVDIDILRPAILDIPVADVAPVVHGEWIGIISCEDIIYATCNRCYSRGKVRTNRNQWGLWYIDSPFCPNCGAHMDGGKK